MRSVEVTHEGRTWIEERLEYGAAGDEAQNARGRLVRHSDQAGVREVRLYDPFGGERESARTIDGETFVTRRDFDALGRVVEERPPDGTLRTQSWLPSGALGRVTIEHAGVRREILSEVELDAHGRRVRARLGGVLVLEERFDPESQRLARSLAIRTSDAATLQDLRLTYDPNGNVVRAIDLAQEPSARAVLRGLGVTSERTYRYDAHDRLREATGRVHRACDAWDFRGDVAAEGVIGGARTVSLDDASAIERYVRTYDVDDGGNVRRVVHRAGARRYAIDKWVSARSNRATFARDPNGVEVRDPESQFDATGNTLALPTLWRLEWDAFGRLARAVVIEREDGPSDDERYAYGADGSRVRKITTTLRDGQLETRETLYLGGGERHRVRLGDHTLLERWSSHVEDETRRLASLDRWAHDEHARETDDPSTPRVRLALSDPLGSTTLELDERGRVASYEEHFPYGGTAFAAGDATREISRRTYRYAGKERDATGLYYFQYRYYAPFLGNWLSPDPAGPVDGVNLYWFARSNPVSLTDPDGLQSRDTQPGIPRSTIVHPHLGQAITTYADGRTLCTGPGCSRAAPDLAPPPPAPPLGLDRLAPQQPTPARRDAPV
ncbi:MAG: hypothetical protein K8H88_32820, partial [Sandaracinaceae bacterium]|nr:hypothetical protein [Sandaracinaceae bacterium]